MKRLDDFEGLYFCGIIILYSACLQASHRVRKMAISFEYGSVIRGYHIYKEIWEASHGETFDCVRETGNRFDPFAVAVISEDGEIIGHVPKLISAAASLFLRYKMR